MSAPTTAISAPSAAPAETPATGRDPWFDNIKMTLVVLVVIGHAWTLLPSLTAVNWLYNFLYAWHIPAFVIITGYLSRSFTWTRPRLWSLVTTVAVPYVLFEGALAWFRHHFGHVHFQHLWADPHWPMWYLSALFFWRLMTPLLLRVPAKVVVAIGLSVVAGLWAGDLFDMARIFGLLPFFVLGLKMHEGHWNLLRTGRARVIAVGVLVALFVLARFTHTLIPSEWLYYRSRYDVLDHDLLRAFTIRTVLLVVGLCGAYAVFALIPRGRGWFTALGSATLVVYLCHGFFVLTANFAGYDDWTAGHVALALPLTTAAAVLVALFLAAGPVSRRLNVVVDPVGTFTRRRRVRAAAPALR
jgi:fucose 4-O-acetylase-like acetyltransferase